MKITRRTIIVSLAVILILAAVFIGYRRLSYKQNGTIDGPPRVTVRFGMLPYGDHTYAIIGIRKGWFEEAGINLEYQPIKVDEVVPFLKNGSLDVSSCGSSILFAAHETNPGAVNFVFGSIFQGFAIMARPDRGYKSVDEFIAQGLSPSDAIKATVAQMKGGVFAYPSEAAVKPFIDLVLQKGELSRKDFKALVLDDPLTVNAMRNKQADFQVGGAPSRLILQREGFKPLLSANDIARAAKPSPESLELASIFPDGWATTLDYYNKNHDTILRLASVNFRIMKFMNEHQEEALSLHMPYLSQTTGQKFTSEEGKVIYESLDPFFTFEAQKEWYHNPQSPYYFQNLNGSIINNFVSQGIYKQPPPKVDDVIYSDDIYYELEDLRAKTDKLFTQIQQSGVTERNRQAADMLESARKYYDAYNYLDAQRTAQKIADLI